MGYPPKVSAPKGWRGRSESPLLASAEAKPSASHTKLLAKGKTSYSPNLMMEERFSTIALAIHGLFIV